MAKKKGARKAAKGPGKRAAKTSSQTVADAAPPAANPATGAEEQILAGADVMRLLTQLCSRVEALSSSDDSISSQLSSIEEAIRANQATIASLQSGTPAAEASTGNASDTSATPTGQQRNPYREGQIHGWRQMLWTSELNQSSPLPMPRASFIGRAMAELGAIRPETAEFSIKSLFQRIQQQGPHHLDQNARRYLELINSGDKLRRKRATSGLNKLFKKRFKQLCGHQLADCDGDRRWLSPVGRDVFRGWPEWLVEHGDIWCEGCTHLITRRTAAQGSGGTQAALQNGST